MATDRWYFAKPTRSLIRELRPYFPLGAQAHMNSVVERYLALADEAIEEQFESGYDFAGNRLCCRAMTRKGTPCQRLPHPRNGYCPSHQHLADADELAHTRVERREPHARARRDRRLHSRPRTDIRCAHARHQVLSAAQRPRHRGGRCWSSACGTTGDAGRAAATGTATTPAVDWTPKAGLPFREPAQLHARDGRLKVRLEARRGRIEVSGAPVVATPSTAASSARRCTSSRATRSRRCSSTRPIRTPTSTSTGSTSARRGSATTSSAPSDRARRSSRR